MLRLDGVSYRYPGAAGDALAGVSLAVDARQFVAVLGPNGSGKTTLVRIALGALVPSAGRADIDGRPARAWKRQELARVIGVVPQREDNLFPQRVRETVLLGRYPHLSMWGRERPEDHAAVQRALAQEPKLLVLDEPGVSLDLKHEMGLFELVRGLVDTQGLGVLMITHDLNLAARFADSIGAISAKPSDRLGLTEPMVPIRREAVHRHLLCARTAFRR